ncbi:hypothetical protein KTS45_12515 [Halomicroarcula limicola]|uniref:Uncharacterized protein n=1 Tax=Haloarcula limicola TaxID=1429915 RepID=A0A8J7Y5B8_9EURY|nr:hypothetical protein [Halomicroarcula limicola]MBV0925020.1 hypothetical protein [Halomicroarcula limicola]
MADNKWINKLNDIASTEGSSLTNVVPKAMLLPVIAFFTSAANAIGAAFNVPIATFDGFSAGVGELTSGLLEGPGQILSAGATESAQSLSQGVWAQFGPLTFPIAVGVVVLAAIVVARARENPATGNFLPGVPFDVPFIGTEEEGD